MNISSLKNIFLPGIPHNQSGSLPHRIAVRLCPAFLFLVITTLPSFAQTTWYVGAIGGVATLSGDAGSQGTSGGLALSSYAPANGGAVNIFAGAHLHDYFSLQGNFIWNRNSLHLNSASSTGGTFYEQDRSSSQQAAVLDFLLYFRRRSSRIRPYLGTGTGVFHLASTAERLVAAGGTPTLPAAKFSFTGPVFRSHVGIDLRLTRKLDFRYSFSEMISQNPISRQLSPPAPRRLANFQNLFGFAVRF